MRVLRIETETGTGPFTKDDSFSMIEEYEYATGFDPGQHPEPSEDGCRGFSRNHICGFKNEAQMREWFPNPEHDHILNNHGLTLATYEVDPSTLLEGNYQVCFVKETSTLINRTPIS